MFDGAFLGGDCNNLIPNFSTGARRRRLIYCGNLLIKRARFFAAALSLNSPGGKPGFQAPGPGRA
jgi:hypothetical protein